ncbi:HIT family protein [Fusibacter ferrireducens]|uniref:HIT family protein n=1 Tax=Fusibacter ferrireducens TaxID=2785058 RepID=UPI001A9B105A|nr:HIT domain-containing protein [Fusibacter ferrireducens]
MISHQPEEYNCPFCLVVEGIENEHVITLQEDIIYKNAYVTAFIASHWWPNNKGHILIVPNRHYENIYEIPVDYICEVHMLEKRVAKAIKKCIQL